MTNEQILVAIGVGLVGALVYGEFLTPLSKSLTQKTTAWWKARRNEKLRETYNRGYGWAWAFALVEKRDLAELESLLDPMPNQSMQATWFDDGAIRALAEIRQYKKLYRDASRCEHC